MRIAIVGGHLSPALSIIEYLPKGTQIIFIGRKHALEADKALSLEYQKINELNIPFENLETGRLQRKITAHTISSLLKLPKGFIRAFKILQKFKPDVVVCFGGYLQIPIAFAAYLLRIPILIHEQTMRAGLANKIVAPLATTICISWPTSAKYFPKQKTTPTGLPLRKEFIKISNHHSPITIHQSPTILITGGSLGAHAINVLIEGVLEKLLKKYYIIHQTGDSQEYKDFDRLNELRNNLSPGLKEKYKLIKFIDPEETAQIMNSADLVISRSGINTVAELLYLKKPAILIPLPYGQSNEQLENAKYFERSGLGKILIQKDITPEILYSQIAEFTAKLDSIDRSAYENQKPANDAAEKIVKIIQKIGKKEGKQT